MKLIQEIEEQRIEEVFANKTYGPDGELSHDYAQGESRFRFRDDEAHSKWTDLEPAGDWVRAHHRDKLIGHILDEHSYRAGTENTALYVRNGKVHEMDLLNDYDGEFATWMVPLDITPNQLDQYLERID